MGSSPDEMKTTLGLGEINCHGGRDGINLGCATFSPGFTYADQRVKFFSADFIEDRLGSIAIETAGGSESILEQAISAKYGRPTAKYKEAQSLKNGIKYKMTVTEWKIKGRGLISMQSHPDPASQVFLSVAAPEYLAWQREARKASIKAKSDI